MFCPNCSQDNPADAEQCGKCQHDTGYFRQRLHIGRQFIFARADADHPIALEVDGSVQTFDAPAILSRHLHAVGFGDTAGDDGGPVDALRRRLTREERRPKPWPLPDQPRLPAPALKLLTLVSDRKIYQPNSEATLFVVAPDAAGQEASLEVQLGGQKVYETKVTLDADGLAMHRYEELKEGEYTAVIALPGDAQAECTFSVAEFTLSPLIATLEEHAYAEKRLSFTLKLLLLSEPYSGKVEFGLQCKVCGDRIVATQKVKVKKGVARGDFDLSGHGGPFHVQVTTPDGNTALVAFPGTGATEREHVKANTLGKTAEMGLLPWEGARPVRGFYVGSGEVNMTPLTLEKVVAASGRLQAASEIAVGQMVTFNPRSGKSETIPLEDLARGQTVEFETAAPYTLFTVGSFSPADDEPFEGWGIVIRPVAFEATLSAPATARPGEEIDVYVEIPATEDETPIPATCWLLVYDARLEHESPIPKLAKRVYESVRDGGGNLAARPVPNALDMRWSPPADVVMAQAAFAGMRPMAGPPRSGILKSMRLAAAPEMAATASPQVLTAVGAPALADVDVAVEAPVMVMSATRMEFPELAYQELFAFSGKGARTVRLGDQIGTWRVRAYVFHGADTQELTADVQADKPLYAELDLPAIASEGDEIGAAVNYFSREPAELLVATPFGETRKQVQGGGMERFTIRGPGRVEVSVVGDGDSDMSARHVLRPGVQSVTASRLRILDRGETAAGERVVVYASVGQVLKETITALTDYPFG